MAMYMYMYMLVHVHANHAMIRIVACSQRFPKSQRCLHDSCPLTCNIILYLLQVVPRFNSEGELEQGHVMHVSWAADHRVIDGAEVARFSNLWRSYVENPALMIVDMK